jgi:hypothetical protein
MECGSLAAAVEVYESLQLEKREPGSRSPHGPRTPRRLG